MINRITDLSAMMGKKYKMPHGTVFFPVVVLDVFDHFEAEFGKTLVLVVAYDSALKLDSLTLKETKECLEKVQEKFPGTWEVLDTLEEWLSDG